MSYCFSSTSRFTAIRYINRYTSLEHTQLPTDLILYILSLIPSCIVIIVNNSNAFVKYKCKYHKKIYYTGYLHKSNINVLCMGIGDKFQLSSGKSTVISKHCTIYISTDTKFNIDAKGFGLLGV